MDLIKKTILIVLCLALCGPVTADTESEIIAALDYFAEIWNEGDLQALKAYYHSDFILVTGGGAIRLEQRIDDLEAIAQAGEDRGELDFSKVRVQALEEKHAVAYGERTLKFKDGSALNNWFTTIYVKTPFGWKALLTHG